MKEGIAKVLIPFAVLIIVAINSNVTEYLTGKDYPAPLMLVFYGVFSLVLNCIAGLFTRQAIFPKQWKFQIVRLVNNGISMLLIFISFKYLSAGSVSLIQRTDIPFVIMLSFFLGEKKSNLQFWLSLWSILTVVFMIVDARLINEESGGFGYAFAGVIMISAGYIIIRKSVAVETVYSLSNVNSIGMILVGTITMFVQHYSWYIDPGHLWIFCLGGLMLFAIYVVAIPLYVWYQPERARFPYILGALGTAIIEMIMERKMYPVSQIALILLISGMIMTISLNANAPEFSYSVLKKIKKRVRKRSVIKISQRA